MAKIDKKHPFTRVKRKVRLVYLKILRIDDPPDRIARGVALGVFMGIFPTFGLGGIFSLALAFVFRANKAASILGTFIMNPLTMPFFTALSIYTGSLVMRQNTADILARFKGESFWHGAEWAYIVFLIGNLIISVIFTLISYYIMKWYIIRHRQRKAARRLEKLRQAHPHHPHHRHGGHQF